MPDPYRKVSVNDELVIPANAWNDAVDAGRAEKQRQNDRLSGDRTTTRDACILRVKNETGGNLSRAAVVGLDGPIFAPSDSLDAFLREVTFRGVTPAASHRGRFAILLAPAASGVVARAYLAGVCPVKVDVIDADHQFADVDPTHTDRLVSAGSGPAQILWREGDAGYGYGYETGEQWALVRIGGGDGGGGARYALTGHDGIPGMVGATLGSGSITLYPRDGSTLVEPDSPEVETCYNAGSTVSGDTFIVVAKVDGAWSVVVEKCPSDAYYY
jgi:hypothetical protein